jgi:hypothetical protein
MLIHGNRNLAPPAKSLTDVKAAHEAKHINLEAPFDGANPLESADDVGAGDL